jgi:hypothetical protein
LNSVDKKNGSSSFQRKSPNDMERIEEMGTSEMAEKIGILV